MVSQAAVHTAVEPEDPGVSARKRLQPRAGSGRWLPRSATVYSCAVGLLSGLGTAWAQAQPVVDVPGVALSTSTDKAAYSPRETVHIKVDLTNGSSAALTGARLRLSIRHLESALPAIADTTVSIPAGGAAARELLWTPPAQDFQGYGYDVSLLDTHRKVIATESGAIDVSSNWLKFPRYGYVAHYDPGVDAAAVIGQLKNYHINALQFYDWQWKHHRPYKGEKGAPAASWADIGNRPTSRDVTRSLIAGAHRAGMVAMQYNLIYGAFADFAADGVDPAWGLYAAIGGPQRKYNMPDGFATPALYLFNAADPGWQRYILDRELEVFDAYAFDGWHADTMGDVAPKYDVHGNPVDIEATFKPFLNAAKARLGSKYLVMNTVSNKGHTGVNTSDVDAVYVEVWPEDGFVDYASLKDVVDLSRQESGGKSLIVPAYIHYDNERKPGEAPPRQFNEPAVLLAEATVLAAGGSRIELGDGTQMLCDPYFPNHSIAVGADLKRRLARYYDFAVTYENLLRDGQSNTQRRVAIDGQPVSSYSTPDVVWAFTKEDARYDIVHLVNLRGLDDTQWQDTHATQKKPQPVHDFKLQFYVDTPVSQAFVASPDSNGGRSGNVPFEAGHDEHGAFVTVTVPSLEYWDVVYFKKSGR